MSKNIWILAVSVLVSFILGLSLGNLFLFNKKIDVSEDVILEETQEYVEEMVLKLYTDHDYRISKLENKIEDLQNLQTIEEIPLKDNKKINEDDNSENIAEENIEENIVDDTVIDNNTQEINTAEEDDEILKLYDKEKKLVGKPMIVIGEKGMFIREAPDLDSKIIASSIKGDEVHVLYKYKEWCEIILAEDKTGWVRSFLLQNKK